MKEKRSEEMTPKELETRLKEYNPHLIVSTTNDGAAYDVEYVAEDKSRIVLYNFRINKYGKAWAELTPIQLFNVRLLIDDYLNEIGDQDYSGDFEIDQSLVPPITILDPKDLKNTNKHKANIFVYTYNHEITERHEVDDYEIDDNVVIASEDGEKWIYPLTSICSIEVPNNGNYSNIHGNCSD